MKVPCVAVAESSYLGLNQAGAAMLYNSGFCLGSLLGQLGL